MKLFLHIIPAVTILAALTSCEKEIDFEYKDIPMQQVIEGLLTQDGINIRLTETIPTDEPFNNNTITDALVTALDITSGESYLLTPDIKGVFTHPSLTGKTGHEYELTVTIGEHTYSSKSTMSEKSEIISADFSWIKMPYDDVAILKVLFTQVGDKMTYYWLRVYRNSEPYQWQTISSQNAMGGLITSMMMTSRKDTDKADADRVLINGDIIDIEVMPVSKNMGDYLYSLNNGDYNGNKMFTGSYCLGYFLAAPISTARLIYSPDQIPFAQ